MTFPKIDLDYLNARLGELLNLPSPTGYTDEAVWALCRELERLGLDYELTRRGAIRVRLPGLEAVPARAIVAHVDTLGAQVKAVKDNGRLELVPIGHWSSRFAEGARCTVFAEGGGYRGTILPLKASGHAFNEEVDDQPVNWRQVELRIDAVIHGRADTLALGVDVGDIVAIDAQPEFTDSGFIVSRHLDDKAGVAVMLAALECMLREERTPRVDTWWLFTIAEEASRSPFRATSRPVEAEAARPIGPRTQFQSNRTRNRRKAATRAKVIPAAMNSGRPGRRTASHTGSRATT
ncbi:M20/M25/M40 family metallo-hydrolase [Brevundimonas naejangsanensis]|uniref:M20/M25/M40 family metallo-hydrolase n=1 Tax=Brevundimonas naejangsanensis TaxID=588932 RepID=UPI0039F6AD37